MRKAIWRAVIEVGFIVFLFYANLPMGGFVHSGRGRERGFVWAATDIFRLTSLAIALTAAFIGYVVVEFPSQEASGLSTIIIALN
jgi:hypothetical protein